MRKYGSAEMWGQKDERVTNIWKWPELDIAAMLVSSGGNKTAVPHSIFYFRFFPDLRTSTGQCFRKELSDQDECME